MGVAPRRRPGPRRSEVPGDPPGDSGESHRAFIIKAEPIRSRLFTQAFGPSGLCIEPRRERRRRAVRCLLTIFKSLAQKLKMMHPYHSACQLRDQPLTILGGHFLDYFSFSFFNSLYTFLFFANYFPIPVLTSTFVIHLFYSD